MLVISVLYIEWNKRLLTVDAALSEVGQAKFIRIWPKMTTCFSCRLCLVVVGFCMFVLSLVKKHYRLQFYMVSGPPASNWPPASRLMNYWWGCLIEKWVTILLYKGSQINRIICFHLCHWNNYYAGEKLLILFKWFVLFFK